MSTDTPAAAPLTAEREAFDAWWTKNYNIQSTLARAAAWMAWSTRADLTAPVAAQPAVSGVDALWVETARNAMQTALDMLRTERYGSADPHKRERAIESVEGALRTHLSTAIGGKING